MELDLQSIGRMIRQLSEGNRSSLYAPKTWDFWRKNLMCFCANNITGHVLEHVYCDFMDARFGLIEDDYAIKFDPWYHPYWVYGIGGLAMTMLIEPLKGEALRRHPTLSGAMAETYAISVLAAMGMELGFGLLVNQPDENGKYPYWDNSQLPLNILKQAWLVNDLAIGAVAIVYVWLIYPLFCKAMDQLSERQANTAFGATVALFAAACVSSYRKLIKAGRL